MQVESESIPNGSVALSIWPSGVDIAVADIEAIVRLDNLGDGQCKARGAIGSLSNDANIAIGLKAIEHEFNYMIFKVVRGKTVSRHAIPLYSDALYDWYGVDLITTKRELGL